MRIIARHLRRTRRPARFSRAAAEPLYKNDRSMVVKRNGHSDVYRMFLDGRPRSSRPDGADKEGRNDVLFPRQSVTSPSDVNNPPTRRGSAALSVVVHDLHTLLIFDFLVPCFTGHLLPPPVSLLRSRSPFGFSCPRFEVTTLRINSLNCWKRTAKR